MKSNTQACAAHQPVRHWFRPGLHWSWLVVLGLLFVTSSAWAQITTGSVSGTVSDTTGAVIPKATITLVNDATKDQRVSTSDATGYFTFAAVQPGTYTVNIAATGFEAWKQPGFVMNSGDPGSSTASSLLSVHPLNRLPSRPMLRRSSR